MRTAGHRSEGHRISPIPALRRGNHNSPGRSTTVLLSERRFGGHRINPLPEFFYELTFNIHPLIFGVPSGTLHGNALRLSGLRRRLMRGRSPLFPPLEGASPLISVSGRKNAPHIAERARSLSLRPGKMHNFAFASFNDRGRKNAPLLQGREAVISSAS